MFSTIVRCKSPEQLIQYSKSHLLFPEFLAMQASLGGWISVSCYPVAVHVPVQEYNQSALMHVCAIALPCFELICERGWGTEGKSAISWGWMIAAPKLNIEHTRHRAIRVQYDQASQMTLL